jgi:hypothetical protein
VDFEAFHICLHAVFSHIFSDISITAGLACIHTLESGHRSKMYLRIICFETCGLILKFFSSKGKKQMYTALNLETYHFSVNPEHLIYCFCDLSLMVRISET